MTCMHQGPPPKEWNCSLERDHDGPHVARTAVGRFTWPNDAEPAGPPDALDELDRLHAAATAGEWESVLCDAPHVNDEVRMIEGPVTRANGKKFVPVISRISPRADADFIAAAKNAWPAISARLRAAEAEVERLRGALREACSHLDMAVEASEESGDLDEEEAQEERDFIKGFV